MTEPTHQPTPAALVEFPDVTSRMQKALDQLELLQQGGPAASDIIGSGENLPRLWDITTIHDPNLRRDTWNWLEGFVIWFNAQQTWFSYEQIPACWTHHPHLIREIGTLADQRRLAGDATTSRPLDEWHQYSAPAFLERTRAARSSCEDKHTPWPGRPAHKRHVGPELSQVRRDRIEADVAGFRRERSPHLGSSV
ncbi:hypothetical protein FOJ82_00395 [Tessaracoccus rhinocerotis]|uniref:DUF4913 domain-containing protein n=1 Tax=Tessaracoccus rhinocerotis TaxID=1689449 RepID=A0A553K3X6_9ACTN|nr:hypothetical protein [Tessaracoccus rhinocerotis]TRY19412.1 hypothetical protein FOJ82_00395 [Tessaracoccus rhinocerotis]